MTQKAWSKIPEKYRDTVKKIANKYISQVNIANLGDNKTAMDEMKKNGVEFLKFSDDDIKKAETYRSKIINRLITSGSLFSKDALTKLEGELGRL